MDAPNATVSGDEPDPATDAVTLSFLHSRLRLLFVFLLLGYGIMCLLSCVLLVYLRIHRRQAFVGNQSAARRVILPAFEPLLVVLAATTFVFSVYYTTALATNVFAFNVSKGTTEIFYSGRQFVFLSVIVLMLQPSVSLLALKKSLVITLFLATYTVPIVALLTQFSLTKDQFYVVHTAARAPLLLLYAYIFVKPPPRASKQTLREFCIYAWIYYALVFAYNDRFCQNEPSTGFVLAYASLLWGSLCPLVIWRVLLADTEHWRRLGHRAVALQQNLSSSQSSTVLSESSSRRGNVLAHECMAANGSHILVEMRRKFVIDFAYLELKDPIARGRCRRASDESRPSVVVYQGVLRGKLPVAVKVYTPPQLDEETIAHFAHEGALCGTLRHPNVVHFVGLCVLPPTICMVNELCMGNLETVTRAQHRKYVDGPVPRARPQLLINLTHMLDAARAIAYLHSFSPPFLHRDITPSSFLVDANGTVKLTHFGDSRSLSTTRTSLRSTVASELAASARVQDPLSSARSLQLSELATPSPSSFILPSQMDDASGWRTPSPVQPPPPAMTIKGTVEYMAPELLQGHAGQASYDEAADVFALAITMWDILYPDQPKYPLAGNNRLKIFDAVLAGERPRVGGELPATLQELLMAAWHQEPRLRPRTDTIVSALEALQEELALPFAQRLVLDLSTNELLHQQQQPHLPPREVVTGAAVVDLFVSNGYTDTESEALRLANALIDASVVHHAAHAKPFEVSEQETYYFDATKLCALCGGHDKRSRKSGRHGLSRTHGPTATRASRSALVLLPRSFLSNSDRQGNHDGWSRRPNTLRRPPSAPVVSRHRRCYDPHCDLPSDPAELLCACRELSQRLHQSRATARKRGADDRLKRTHEQESHGLRKAKSSPRLDHSHSHFISIPTDDEGSATDRMTDWEDFGLSVEDSDVDDASGCTVRVV